MRQRDVDLANALYKTDKLAKYDQDNRDKH